MNPADLAELAPLLRRVASLNPRTGVRLRADLAAVTAYARLPFGVLVARTVELPVPAPSDETFDAGELLARLDGAPGDLRPRPQIWRGPLPPDAGWRRLEQVPDGDIRRVVRAAAIAIKEAAGRRDVADALLDAVGLVASDGDATAEVTVRTLSALTRMGFLTRDSHAFIDINGGWTRVAGRYGNVYAERFPRPDTSIPVSSVV